MKRKGFTLIEMLTSLAVLAALSAAIGSVFVSLFRDWQRQRDYYRSFQDAGWALGFMSDEFRHANSTFCGILNPNATSFSFIKNCQVAGGTTNCAGCKNWDRVYYWLDTSNFILYRSQANPSVSDDNAWYSDTYANKKEFARSVADANFTWSTSNATLSMELTVRPFPLRAVGPGNQERRLRTSVKPRN